MLGATGDWNFIASGEAEPAVLWPATGVAVVVVEAGTHQPREVAVVVGRTEVTAPTPQRFVVDGALAVGATVVVLDVAIVGDTAGESRRSRSHLRRAAVAGERTIHFACIGAGVVAVVAQLALPTVVVELQTRRDLRVRGIAHLIVEVTALGVARVPESPKHLTTLHPLTVLYEDLLQVVVVGDIAVGVVVELDVVPRVVRAGVAVVVCRSHCRHDAPVGHGDHRLTAVSVARAFVEVPGVVAAVGVCPERLTAMERQVVGRRRGLLEVLDAGREPFVVAVIRVVLDLRIMELPVVVEAAAAAHRHDAQERHAADPDELPVGFQGAHTVDTGRFHLSSS